MVNLTLKVTQKEGMNMSSLVKLMCSLKCRINADLTNGDIVISDMEDSNIENVIDSISEAFTITDIDIVPTIVDSKSETNVEESPTECASTNHYSIKVRKQFNNLTEAVNRAFSQKAKAKDICLYLKTASTEISTRYNANFPVKFAVGDIVDCNYGFHLKNEMAGEHVHAIICDITDEGLVYAIPVAQKIEDVDPTRYLPFTANVDVRYHSYSYLGGTALLKMGRYIHRLRVNKVLGYVFPEFLKKLLMVVPTAFDFLSTDYAYESAEKSVHVHDNVGSQAFLVKSESENTEEPTVQESLNAAKPEESPNQSSKKLSKEEYLTNIVSDALESLDNSKAIAEQINKFMEAISLSSHGNEEIIKDSFLVACKIPTINYHNICNLVNNNFPTYSEKTIKAILKSTFTEWIAEYPEVKAQYANVSMTDLLKIFAKKMK